MNVQSFLARFSRKPVSVRERGWATGSAPMLATDAEVAECLDFNDALFKAINHSRKPYDEIADFVGMSVGHLCDCVKGRKHFPMGKAYDFAFATGTWLVQQWVAYDSGFVLERRRMPFNAGIDVQQVNA